MKLFQLYISLILLILTCQQYENLQISNDLKKCAYSDKTQCKSITLSNKNMECCEVNINYIGGYLSNTDFDGCSISSKIKMTPELIESAERIYTEAYGFVITAIGYDYSYYSDYILSFRITANCPSQSYTINYKTRTYTDEEIKIFKKDNYCLRYYYQGLMDMNLLPEGILNLERKTITKDDCKNAVLLPSSENIATCAYASLDFKLQDGTTKQLNTCFYISKSSFDTLTLDQHLESSFQSYTSINGVQVTSYEIEISDKEGKALKYDSISGQIISGNPQNKSEIIGISKIIFIILMFYLL